MDLAMRDVGNAGFGPMQVVDRFPNDQLQTFNNINSIQFIDAQIGQVFVNTSDT